jgi:Tfp pilus assembly protein PilW
MERKPARTGPHDHRFSNIGGFGLVELLVCVTIAGFLGLGVWELMGSQSRTYHANDNNVVMQQNLRIAVDTVSSSLMMAASVSGSANTISIGAFVGTFIGRTDGQANPGDTALNLKTGQGVKFPVGTVISVSGVEVRIVQAVAGDRLTLDRGLTATHPGNSAVRQVVTSTTFAVDGHNNLTVTEGGATKTIATNISRLALTVDPSNPTLLGLAIDGTTGGTASITSTIRNSVFVRNAST